jgi:uncharacterized membrane-anchored protein YhcB (DUF1043 family)
LLNVSDSWYYIVWKTDTTAGSQLEQQRQESQEAQQCQKCHFRQQAELTDLARKYQELNAELNQNDDNSRRLLVLCAGRSSSPGRDTSIGQ